MKVPMQGHKEGYYSSAKEVLSKLRVKQGNKLIIGNLNINSISEKFDQLKVLISKNLDILVITETKLDSTFPVTQFLIEGYKSYWLDRNRHGGGILVFVREDIPSKELSKHTQPSDIEGIFLEINLRKQDGYCLLAINLQ